MSDPVTNIEIEDVLSSIRRLVSDGDKARTRDPARIETSTVPAPVSPAPESQAHHAADSDIDPPKSAARPAKLVLTPAFLVSDSAPEAEPARGSDPDSVEAFQTPGDEATAVEDTGSDANADAEIDENVDDAPLALTEMIWDVLAEEADAAQDADTTGIREGSVTTPDRSRLVATIAELEAAVSADANDYEPEGNEPMGETIAWPGVMSRRFHADEDAELSDEDVAVEVADFDAPPPTDHSSEDANDDSIRDDSAKDDGASFQRATPKAHHAHAGSPDPDRTAPADFATSEADGDIYGDDDLDGLLEAGGVTLDEAALRALVSEVVREELTGPLGERITRNVRKLVRREIYRVLSSQEFD